MRTINPLAVLVAFIALQALGFFWYGESLFGTPWMRDAGFDPADLPAPHPMVWVTMAVGTLVKIVLLGVILEALRVETIGKAVLWGFVLGLGLLALTLASHHGFAMRPVRQILIEGSQEIVGYVIAAAILTAMPRRASIE